MTLNLSDTIERVAMLDQQAATIAAALDVHLRAESEHAKRGGLHRLRSALLDLHYGLMQARDRFARAKVVGKII